MNTEKFELISYHLCPYVQRSVITLLEKQIPFKRTFINLRDKPDWFKVLSPTSKVPLLKVGDEDVLFESAVICEYLDEITPDSLFPSAPFEKAKYRGWIEFGSQILNVISQYYSTKDESYFMAAREALINKFARIEPHVVGPYFGGAAFSMVDAVYAPIFRYFDVFQTRMEDDLFDLFPNLQSWRERLAKRESVQSAVDPEYSKALLDFVKVKGSYLASKL